MLRALLSITIAVALLLAIAARSSASPASTTRVSVSSTGMEANDESRLAPAISADGRFVAFSSHASNLVSGDTNTCVGSTTIPGSCEDVFVHDLATSTTTRVSVDSAGQQADGFSESPSLSANGRYVAFDSVATNLVPGDNNTCGGYSPSCRDVFVHDSVTGSTERVSVSTNGGEANAESFSPVISGDGRFVAFVSRASNLVAGDDNNTYDIFVHDRESGITERVSMDSAGNESNGSSTDEPAISADGRYVVFESYASNLVLGDTNVCYSIPSCSDVFIHDRVTGATARLSVDSAGVQADNASGEPAISPDGRFVGFSSSATNLVSGDSNGTQDVFIHDLITNATERVSVDSAGQQGDGDSFDPALSANGRYVAFWSTASNLVPDDTPSCAPFISCSDTFVRDRLTATTVRVSIDSAGNQANCGTPNPPLCAFGAAISATGGEVAFNSLADNLVQGDTNNYCDTDADGIYDDNCRDIFVHALSDTDGDGEWDVFDPCPLVADCDADGWSDGSEITIGTDPLDACADTATANDEAIDKMPADLNDDRRVNTTDRVLVMRAMRAYKRGLYDRRFDLNTDGRIDRIDRDIVDLYITATGGLPCA